jgi:hypothetical protein
LRAIARIDIYFKEAAATFTVRGSAPAGRELMEEKAIDDGVPFFAGGEVEEKGA